MQGWEKKQVQRYYMIFSSVKKWQKHAMIHVLRFLQWNPLPLPEHEARSTCLWSSEGEGWTSGATCLDDREKGLLDPSVPVTSVLCKLSQWFRSISSLSHDTGLYSVLRRVSLRSNYVGAWQVHAHDMLVLCLPPEECAHCAQWSFQRERDPAILWK